MREGICCLLCITKTAMNRPCSSQFLLCGFFVYLLHILHIHPRRNPPRIPAFHTVVDVGVLRRDLWAALAQGLLYDAQILGLLIEVRAAAVAEEVARIAGLFQPRGRQCLVDDVADADACDAPVLIVRRTGDDGRRETLLGRDGTACFNVCLEELKGFLAWVDDSRVSFASDLNASALPVDVLVREAHDLDDAQPLDAHEVDDEEVAQAAQGVLVSGKSLADLLDLIDGEVFIVLVEVLRVAQLQVGTGVFGDEGEPFCDLVKRADCRALDHECCRAVAARAHLLHVDADLIVVHVVQRMETLLHAPVEKQSDGEFIGVACVRCGSTARNVAREIFVEVGDEILRRDGILSHARRNLAHAPHIAGHTLCTPRRNAHLCGAAAAIAFGCRQKITRFRFLR